MSKTSYEVDLCVNVTAGADICRILLVFMCVTVSTELLLLSVHTSAEISGSAALNQNSAELFFLLPVVEVFRVSIHVCVIQSEKNAVFDGSSPQSRIFSSCVWG